MVVFGVLVGRARGQYGIAAPATTGHPVFERYYRVQMNTVESLLVFLPGLWLAAKYWSPGYCGHAGRGLPGGSLHISQRLRQGSQEAQRGVRTDACCPTLALVVAALIGAIRALAKG